MYLTDIFTDLFYFLVVNREYEFAQFSYSQLHQKFRDLISNAEEQAKRHNIDDRKWSDSLFAISAWIDETVLLSEWPFRVEWQKESLQRIYFHTANGGEEFYSRLDALDTKDTDTRAIYDLCLSFGFKGTYFNESDELKRKEIVGNNYRLFASQCDLSIPEILFPDASGGYDRSYKYKKNNYALLFRLSLFVIPPLVFFFFCFITESNLNRLFNEWFSGF